MRRRLLNLPTALSLLLCVAAAALWARSHRATDTIRFSGSREVRIVTSQGAAVIASRSADRGSLDGSVEFGSSDRPWESDYIFEYSLFRPEEPAGPPPGPGWIEQPFDSFRSVGLGFVTLCCALLPACRLGFFWSRRRKGTRNEHPAPAAVRPRMPRLLRPALAASWVLLGVSVLGWVDSATWHLQSLSWRQGVVGLVSNWGRCEFILYGDWRALPPADEPRAVPTAYNRPSVLTWHRAWLGPSGRGHQSPERLQLFTWFEGGLDRENGGIFGGPSDGLFAPSESAGSSSTTGVPTTPGPVVGFSVHVPYWSVVLLVAVLPAMSLLRARRSRRRQSAGLCPACGYDLRATPGRCPECGTMATTPG